MTRGKNITEQEFSAIKGLLDAGVKDVQAAKAMGRSAATMSRIRLSDSWKEYMELVRRENSRYKPKPEPVSSNEVEPEPMADAQATEIQGIVPELQRIASALERLVEAWERKPEGTDSSPLQDAAESKGFWGRKRIQDKEVA